jgi:hypothetical protein
VREVAHPRRFHGFDHSTKRTTVRTRLFE